MLKQLSLYVENKKGTMRNITSILKEEEINILGSVNNDGAEYGIIRMVVSAPERAHEALKKAGYMCRLVDVMGFELADEVGILIMHAEDEDIYEIESCMETKGFTAV